MNKHDLIRIETHEDDHPIWVIRADTGELLGKLKHEGDVDLFLSLLSDEAFA